MFSKRKMKNYSSSNPLPLQQRAISNTMFEYLGISGIVFIALIVMIFELGDDLDQLTYILIVFPLVVMFIFYVIRFILCFSILRKFTAIQYTSERVVSINCQRVAFVFKTISKYVSAIAYIVLTDEQGDKFTYVYPEEKEPSVLAKKNIKERCVGTKMEIICYKNTNIIKKLPSEIK